MTTDVTIQQSDQAGTRTYSIMPRGEALKRCGVSFNPTANEDVEFLKLAAATFMQAINDVADKGEVNGDRLRCFATAKTQLESAQHFAVKGVFQ